MTQFTLAALRILDPLVLPRDLFTLDFVSSTLANLANALGISMLMATLPLYVMSLGGNKTNTGIVAGAVQLTAMLLRPFVGWLTDAWHPV